MRILVILSFLLTSSLLSAQATPDAATANLESEVAEAGINWMTWNEAYEANKKEKRKILVDVYTDWCSWCKKMDKTTFLDAEVVAELNKNFYAIKFNAEQKETIKFNDYDFVHTPGGRNGTHQLAFSLLNGRLGYPAFVTLDENFNRVRLSPGYKKTNQMLQELKFVSSEAYKKEDFDEWR